LGRIGLTGILSLAVPTAALAIDAPPKRAHHALVYDESREQVLLTGGSTPLNRGQSFQFFNDVWSFDGATWRLLAESGDRLSGIGLAYDTRRGRVVSFAGYNGQTADALRSLDGKEWRVLGRFAEMAAAEPGFVYDAERDRFVVFGGSAGQGRATGDTWEYDGTAWTRVAVAEPPPPRQAHAMVYDQRRKRTVLFGGMGSAKPGQPPPSLADTWEYDGRSWTRREASGPSARHAAGVAYDSKRGLVVLFGGAGADGFLGDTWVWDGAAWKKLSDSGPEPRAMGYLAYDKRRDRIVLFGGRKGWPDGDLNDTWEWDGASWRRIGAPAPAGP